MESNKKQAGGITLGIPGVVIGVLLALKHVGLTNIGYGGILLYGFEIWLCCVAIALVIWFIVIIFLLLTKQY